MLASLESKSIGNGAGADERDLELDEAMMVVFGGKMIADGEGNVGPGKEGRKEVIFG